MRPTGLAKTGGRQKGTQNKSTPQKKEQAPFFHSLIDDETEAKFWRYFMCGYIVDVQEDGSRKIVPIPINPVSWASFKRAVEYKRGMPIQPIAARIEGTVQIVTNIQLPAQEHT